MKESSARKAVSNAVKKGILIRPNNCTRCGSMCKPRGHHENYDKPLVVIWLCARCHNYVHGNNFVFIKNSAEIVKKWL